jgi:hypothetical protein
VKNGRERLTFSILEIYRCHTLKDVLISFFFHPLITLFLNIGMKTKIKNKDDFEDLLVLS